MATEEECEEDYSRSCTPESLASGVINPEIYSEEEEDLDESIEQSIVVSLSCV